MLKVLYAAADNQNAKIQLERFLKSVKNKPYIIKVAAYRQSSPSINIDWTLDCLLNMFKPDLFSLGENENLETYYNQVKYFNPDLIISDLEYFTSYIANLLNIKLWQCSSSLINFALTRREKYNLGVFKKHAYMFYKNPLIVQRTINIIENSDWCGVYSHFGDSDRTPDIQSKYEWVRPYHNIGKNYIPCQHSIVAAMTGNNIKILDVIKRHMDAVAFMDTAPGNYQNITVKPLSNQEEYFCNLRNCELFVCGGQTSFLADAFYNGKHAAVVPILKDAESAINSEISESFGISTSIYNAQDLIPLFGAQVSPKYSPNIKYLHEKLDEL